MWDIPYLVCMLIARNTTLFFHLAQSIHVAHLALCSRLSCPVDMDISFLLKKLQLKPLTS